MNSIQRSIIIDYKSTLIRDLHAESLLSYLPCLTSADRDRIRHQPIGRDKNELLLDILQTKNGSWQQLLQALNDQNQDNLAKLLNECIKKEAGKQKRPELLEELKQHLIKFYLNEFTSCKSLFPGATENIADLYVNGCWLDLSSVLQGSSSQREVSEKLKDFYNGNSDSLKSNVISCRKFDNYKDILQIIQNHNMRQALVTGDAGVGKTTFVKKLCYDWARQANNSAARESGRRLHRYKFVFVIPLRNVEEAGTLPELALRFLDRHRVHEYSAELVKLVEEYCRNRSDTILFLLDGLDEYKWTRLKQNNLKYPPLEKILNGDENAAEIGPSLPGTIIITTRPKAAINAKAVQIYFRLLGLTSESIKNYIETFFGLRKADGKVPLVVAALKRHPYFGTIPMLLMLTCHLVNCDIEIPTGHRNEIYDKICLMMFKRAKVSGRLLIQKLENWKELEIAQQLMHLAFEGVFKGKLTFSMADLKQSKVDPEKVRQLGLLREDYFFSFCSDGSKSPPCIDEFSFPHKSIQEYFASEFVRALSRKRRSLSSPLNQIFLGKSTCRTNKAVLTKFFRKLKTTAAFYASEHDLADYLSSVGPGCKEVDLSTAYLIAVENSSHQCLVILQKLGVNYPDIYRDNRPLLRAVELGNINTVKALLKTAGDINKGDEIGKTALMAAASAKHTEVVELLIANGAEVDKQDNDGMTALTKAAWDKDAKMLKLLLSNGAKIDKRGKNGSTALIHAASAGNSEVVTLLLANGAEIDKTENSGQTALITAASADKIEVVKLLIANGADIDKMDDYGQTALIKAAGNGNTEMVNLLLTRGASIYKTGVSGQTALVKAVVNGNSEAVEVLLASGAAIDKSANSGPAALLEAASTGSAEVVKLLLESGVEVDKTDGFGQTALMKAAFAGKTEVVKVLLANRAEIDKTNNSGQTALIIAAWAGKAAVVKLLLASGAAFDKRDDGGQTALIIAASVGNTEVVNLLHVTGATIDKSDISGQTALVNAVRDRHIEAVELLLASGAAINKRDNSGPTVLREAALIGNVEVVKLLLESGVEVDETDDSGQTALIKAAWAGKTEVVKLLLANGAELHKTDKFGRTALMEATLAGNTEVVKLLRASRANVARTDFCFRVVPRKVTSNYNAEATGLLGAKKVKPKHTANSLPAVLRGGSPICNTDVGRCQLLCSAGIDKKYSHPPQGKPFSACNVEVVNCQLVYGTHIDIGDNYEHIAPRKFVSTNNGDAVNLLGANGGKARQTNNSIAVKKVTVADNPEVAKRELEGSTKNNKEDFKPTAPGKAISTSNTEVVKHQLAWGANDNVADSYKPVVPEKPKRFRNAEVLNLPAESRINGSQTTNFIHIVPREIPSTCSNEAIKRHLSKSPAVDKRFICNRIPPSETSSNGNGEVVQHQFENGAEIDLANRYDCTAPRMAISNNRELVNLKVVNDETFRKTVPKEVTVIGTVEAIKRKLEDSTKNNKEDFKPTASGKAISTGNIEVVKHQLAWGANDNVADSYKPAVPEKPKRFRNAEVLNLPAKCGIIGNQTTNFVCIVPKKTPLTCSNEAVKRQLTNSPAIGKKPTCRPINPSETSSNANGEVVEHQFGSGAEIDLANRYECTAPRMAISNNCDVVNLNVVNQEKAGQTVNSAHKVEKETTPTGTIEVVKRRLASIEKMKKQTALDVNTVSTGNADVMKHQSAWNGETERGVNNKHIATVSVNDEAANPQSVNRVKAGKLDHFVSTVLMEAASTGKAEVLKLLLSNGVVVDQTDDTGQTALMIAAKAGKAEVVNFLLANGAEIDKADISGHTALITAALANEAEVVNLLLIKGAEINKTNNSGQTALINAAWAGRTEIVKLLLGNGAEIDKTDNNGHTALMAADSAGYVEVVDLLLASGGELHKKHNF